MARAKTNGIAVHFLAPAQRLLPLANVGGASPRLVDHNIANVLGQLGGVPAQTEAEVSLDEAGEYFVTTATSSPGPPSVVPPRRIYCIPADGYLSDTRLRRPFANHEAVAQFGGGGTAFGAASYWWPMPFEIVGEITQIQPIAVGTSILDLPRLRRLYGRGRWRKLKGVALVRLRSGRIRMAELHSYEAHGIGRKELKRKGYVD